MTADSVSWDEKLSPELAKEWNAWREDMLLLNQLKIRRCYKSQNLGRVVDVTLHCFADASYIGYGVACYLRMVDENGKVEVSLVMGKSRVSPLKPTTIPRLELTAATVAAKIAAMVLAELGLGIKAYYWIDNRVVLGWIFNDKRRFRVFVGNRVQLIDTYTNKKQWRYIDTMFNPSDYASRGISPKDEEKVDKWFNGPIMLREKDEPWRDVMPEVEVVANDAEVKTAVNATAVTTHTVLDVLEERISSWHRMKRSVVWAKRFGSREWRSGKQQEITVDEIQRAEMKIIKLMQERAYKEEIEALRTGVQGKKDMERLKKLNPFIDQDGILRVGGRLVNSEEEDAFRFPVVIPKGAVATKVLIEWHHRQIEHRGKHATINRLREQGFWVVNASKEVAAVVFRCVRCRWLRGKLGNQMMADLPWNRTTVAPPFTYCGVDVFGPLQVKDGRKVLKRYGVLFTCFSLRAVQIELAATLETDSFIQALRRFIARRGAVREIRSDNGTNFVGAESELRKAYEEMDQTKIGNFLTEQGCDYVTWERNTPAASHMGGVWERQIRTVKGVLCSLVKSSPRRLDEESLRTFLAEAEGIVNSRPLTLENLHDPDSQPLSPSQILTMKTRVASPPPGVFQGDGVYARKRWRVVQHMADSFWSRWRKEYLQLLQCRSKWTGVKRSLQDGDIVLMKDEEIPRGRWPLALVTEAHKSKDGLVRSVTLRAKGSSFKRPVHKTVLLVAREEK